MATENTAIFPAVSSFQMRRQVAGGADEPMTDAAFLDLMRRWVFPAKAGDDAFGINAFFMRQQLEEHPDLEPQDYDDDNGVTESQQEMSGAKPYMLTVEKLADGKAHLILYTVDLTIQDDLDFFFLLKNPQITSTGDDKIKRFDGGDIGLASSGLAWQLLDVGDFTPKQGAMIDPTNGQPKARLAPFLLFNVKDIS